MGTAEASDGASQELLVAYLHLPRHASQATRAVLEGHVHSFANREGFHLHRLLACLKTPPDDGADVRDLIDCVQMDGIKKVLVVGPAQQALLALHRLRGVQILTLAQVRTPSENSHTRTGLTTPTFPTRKPGGTRR